MIFICFTSTNGLFFGIEISHIDNDLFLTLQIVQLTQIRNEANLFHLVVDTLRIGRERTFGHHAGIEIVDGVLVVQQLVAHVVELGKEIETLEREELVLSEQIVVAGVAAARCRRRRRRGRRGGHKRRVLHERDGQTEVEIDEAFEQTRLDERLEQKDAMTQRQIGTRRRIRVVAQTTQIVDVRLGRVVLERLEQRLALLIHEIVFGQVGRELLIVMVLRCRTYRQRSSHTSKFINKN